MPTATPSQPYCNKLRKKEIYQDISLLVAFPIETFFLAYCSDAKVNYWSHSLYQYDLRDCKTTDTSKNYLTIISRKIVRKPSQTRAYPGSEPGGAGRQTIKICCPSLGTPLDIMLKFAPETLYVINLFQFYLIFLSENLCYVRKCVFLK